MPGFYNGAGSVTLQHLLLMAANTVCIDVSNPLPVRLWQCMSNNPWVSVDADFQDSAGSQKILILPLKAASTTFMGVCNQSPVRLLNMQDQRLFIHHWHSFTGWGWKPVHIIWASDGSQYLFDGYFQPIVDYITQDAMLNIVDELLPGINRMGHWPCHWLFLPLTAANTLVMHNSNQITFQLSYLEDQISMRLSWHTFY